MTGKSGVKAAVVQPTSETRTGNGGWWFTAETGVLEAAWWLTAETGVLEAARSCPAAASGRRPQKRHGITGARLLWTGHPGERAAAEWRKSMRNEAFIDLLSSYYKMQLCVPMTLLLYA